MEEEEEEEEAKEKNYIFKGKGPAGGRGKIERERGQWRACLSCRGRWYRVPVDVHENLSRP